MKILIKKAVILDESSSFHKQERDILIENGILTKIEKEISEPVARTIQQEGLHVSQGWFDSSVSFGEPGYEDRETIENGLMVAARSGFTGVAVNSNTAPVADSKGIIRFIKSKSADKPVDLYPVGALTVGSNGVDLAELFDMQHEGAISFYDYKKSIDNANLLKIALQYSQGFNGLVQSFPMEKTIAGKGFVNEGIHSTRLGLKGIPAFAESLRIARDLKILEYTGGRLHIPTISTKESVDLIRNAKKNGLDVSCSVAIFNLVLTDDVLDTFNSDYKLLPPLRSKEDISALVAGLKDGTIDCVTSDHQPIDVEQKHVEFDHALYGSIGLEGCFGVLNNIFGTEETVRLLTRAKATFGINEFPIAIENQANITLFVPEGTSVFSEEDIYSTSKNAALKDLKLKGHVVGIFANGQLALNS